MSATAAITTMTYAAALEAAIAAEMRADPSIFQMGTALSPAAIEEFGPARVRVTPISEPGMTGIAVGAASAGKRPVVNWRNITFAMNSFDQVVNQAAKIRYMLNGQTKVPVVFRAVSGGGQRLAAQHSQSPYSLLAHIPGLKVIVPSCAADAYGLMRAAIRDDNPVICFEPGRLMATEEPVDQELVLPLGKAAVRRSGSDVTLVAIGFMVGLAEAAATELEADGVSTELIDVRSVAPLDLESIKASVRRTGRLVVADEAPEICSVASEICAAVASDPTCFAALQAPPVRVCALPAPVPFSASLEDYVLPDQGDVLGGLRRALGRPA